MYYWHDIDHTHYLVALLVLEVPDGSHGQPRKPSAGSLHRVQHALPPLEVKLFTRYFSMEVLFIPILHTGTGHHCENDKFAMDSRYLVQFPRANMLY